MIRKTILVGLFLWVGVAHAALNVLDKNEIGINFSNISSTSLTLVRVLASNEFGCPEWPHKKRLPLKEEGGSFSAEIGTQLCFDPEMFSARYYVMGKKAYVKVMCSYDIMGCDVKSQGFPLEMGNNAMTVKSDFDPSMEAFNIAFSNL